MEGAVWRGNSKWDAKQVQGPARDEVYKCLEEYKTNQCAIGVTIYKLNQSVVRQMLCPKFGVITRFVQQAVLSHADGS
jgi:hypothetical protein